MLEKDLNGYEVIQIKHNTLIDTHHIDIQKADYLTFNETDVSLETIKSLSINI